MAEASAAAATGTSGGERAKWRSEEERSAVGQMKARQEGAGQARAAAWRAHQRMAATRCARSITAGLVRSDGRGAREQERGAEQAEQACAARPKARRAAHLLKNVLFSNSFQILFHSNEILNYFKAVSKVGVKMKVVPFFKIYNFAFVTKSNSK